MKNKKEKQKIKNSDSMAEISNLEIAYSFLEVKYIKAMGKEVSIDPRVNADLFPFGWHSNRDLVKKSHILMEAIEKKCLIIETKGYLEIEEGVRYELNDKNMDDNYSK